MNRQSPSSASLNRRARLQAGFTLLELLAVIFIIGIIVSFASLSVGQNTQRVVQDEAERIHALVRLASEEAVLQGRELGLEFNKHGYRFLVLSGEEWLPIEDDKMFRERELPEIIEFDLLLDGQVEANFDDKDNPPRVFILSSGELTPFELRLRADNGNEFVIQGSIDGKLQLNQGNRHEG